MSGEITQKLGFDVGGALSALNKLEQSVNGFGNSIQNLGNALNKFDSGKVFDKLGGSADQNLGRASQRVTRLTVDWQTMVRIVTTQAIVRGLSALRNTFDDAFDSAVRFQQQIGRTLTIADGQSFDGLADKVRALSDEFNVPLQNVAEGLQQTISNQVGESLEESAEFLETALRFSKATGASTADSVDLLSGAITSFGLDVSQAETVASQFFRTIDLGRVEASELANTFGRVGPQAAQLGIRLDELNAAISTTTLPGVKTSEALTQLRGIMTALVKPTERMQEAFRELGASSAEEAVRIYRFDGLLGALAKSANGSSAEFARMFPNVRGLTGAISIGQRDLELFATNIGKVGSAGADLNASKALQATANDAEAATRELNKLKNALTVDLGQSLLKATANTFDFIGGAETLIKVSQASGYAILGVGTALATFAARSKLGIDSASRLGSALNKLSMFAAGAGLAASAGDFLGTTIAETMRSGQTALEKSNQESLDRFRAQQQEVLRITSETNRKRVDSLIRASQDAAKAYQAEVREIAKANQSLVNQTESTVRSIVSAREGYVRELTRAVEESRQAVRSSQDRISELQTQADDRGFAQSLRAMDDGSAALALLNRSRALAEEAARDLGTAVSSDQVAKALQTFRRAESAGEQAESIAQRLQNQGLLNQAAEALNGITQKQIASEQQLQKVQDDRRRKAEQERDQQERLTAQLKEQTKILLENTSLFDQSGKPFSIEQQAERAKSRRDALQQISGLALSGQDFKTADALGLARFAQEFERELAGSPVQLQFDVQKGIEDVKQQLHTAFANFEARVPFNVGELSAATGKQFATPEETFAGLEQAHGDTDKLKASLAELPDLQKKAAALRQEIRGISDDAASGTRVALRFLGDPLKLFSTELKPAAAAVGTLRNELAQLSKSGKVTDADLKRLHEQLGKLNEFAHAGIDNAGFKYDVERFSEAILKLKELQGVTQQLASHAAGDDATLTRLDKLQSFLSNTNPAQALQSSATALGSAAGPAEAIAGSLERSAGALQTAADSLNNAKPPTIQTVAPQFEAFGGAIQRYFADGGLNRGSDTVPAMLSAGEFVVNSRAASAFATQLQAINAGMKPNFRSEGGSVNVGDINVTVNESKRPGLTGREVATAMRREFRRDSVRIR